MEGLSLAGLPRLVFFFLFMKKAGIPKIFEHQLRLLLQRVTTNIVRYVYCHNYCHNGTIDIGIYNEKYENTFIFLYFVSQHAVLHILNGQ